LNTLRILTYKNTVPNLTLGFKSNSWKTRYVNRVPEVSPYCLSINKRLTKRHNWHITEK